MKHVLNIVALLLAASMAPAQEDDAYKSAVNRMIQLPIAGKDLAETARLVLVAAPADATRKAFESSCATNKDVSSLFLTLTGSEMRALGFTLDENKSIQLLNRMLTGESPISAKDITYADVRRISPRLVSGAIELSAEGILKARLLFRVVNRDGTWTPDRLDIWNPHTNEVVPLFEWSESRTTLVTRMRQRSRDQGGEQQGGEYSPPAARPAQPTP